MSNLHRFLSWWNERFWDFRQGHGVYLSNVLGFMSFITVTYVLLISKIPEMEKIFPTVYIYAAFFLITYPCAAIIVGFKIFRKSQFKTDLEIGVIENPYLFKATEGKEKDLMLPLQIWMIKSIVEIKKALGIAEEDDLKEAQEYIETCRDLAKGKNIKKPSLPRAKRE